MEHTLQKADTNIHLMSGPERNSLTFPERFDVSRDEVEEKENCMPRDWALSVLLYSDRDKKKRKRVNSYLNSFCRFFGDDSSAETSIRNTKSDATSILIAFCVFTESFPVYKMTYLAV